MTINWNKLNCWHEKIKYYTSSPPNNTNMFLIRQFLFNYAIKTVCYKESCYRGAGDCISYKFMCHYQKLYMFTNMLAATSVRIFLNI